MLTENSTFEAFANAAKQKRVIGFGVGRSLSEAINTLSKHGHNIEYVVDNDFWKWGKEHCGIRICSPSILTKEDFENIVVLICIDAIFDIEKQLIDMGITEYYAYSLWVDKIYEQSSRTVLINYSGKEISL